MMNTNLVSIDCVGLTGLFRGPNHGIRSKPADIMVKSLNCPNQTDGLLLPSSRSSKTIKNLLFFRTEGVVTSMPCGHAMSTMSP